MKSSVQHLLKPTAKNVNHNVKVKSSVSTVLIQLLIIAATSGRLGNLGDQKRCCQTVTTALFSDQLFAKRSSIDSHSNHCLN